MKKFLLIIGCMAVVLCFAAPSIVINAGSLRTSNESYVTVTGGSVINASSGTPFYAVHTKLCSAATIFKGPEGTLDALTITPSGDMGSVTVTEYSGSFHPNTTTSVKQWWNVNPTTLHSCSLTFRFRNGYLGSLTLANLAVYEYSGGWVKLSETITSSNVGASFTDITFSGINLVAAKGPHPLILGDKNDATLPVELSSFTATVNAYHNVQLQWVTQSETNVMGFRIYRGSLEALSTAELLPAFIPATNTSQVQYYLFTDEELSQPGIYYYWLENVDLDGGSNIYGPVSVNFDDPEPGSPEIPIVAGINTIFPNPFNPYTSIRIGVETDARTQINIYNIRGQIVRRLMDKNLQKGTWTITWNGNDDNNNSCSSGLYFMRMTTGKDSYSRKLMLLK